MSLLKTSYLILAKAFNGLSHRGLVWLLTLIPLAFGTWTARGDWPEFRGPWGDGHVSAPGNAKPVGFPLHWSETNNIKWKTEIPHRGWSTPVVMRGQVWVTTATLDGHDFFAIGVDAETGQIRFNEKVFHSDDPEPLGNGASMNCYATPSPVIEPGRVYVHFGSFGTACLDTSTGKVLWKRTDLPCRHYRGPSSSLISFENLLILTMDGANLQYHLALDKQTGKTVWKTDRSAAWNDENVPGQMARDGDLRKAHSTPLIVTVAGKPQMISAGAKAAYGYDPRTGRELWKVQHPDYSVAPRPLFDRGVAFIVTGLSKRELWAVKMDGQGDVTDTHAVWKANTHIGKYASPLLVDGLIYTAAEENYVTCLEAATGQVVWTERIAGKYAASPIYADGRLYFFNQQGTTTVLKPGRTFEVLATNTLGDGFMASPAASGRAFFLRTRTHLYRVESSGTEAAAVMRGTTTSSDLVKPIDWRHRIEPKELATSGKGTWTSPVVKAEFLFDELIYCWNARLPREEGFRLYVQVEFGRGDVSPWLYAGFWGKVQLCAKRAKPTFDQGLLDEDTLRLKSRATSYRFKVVDEGEAPLTVLPAIQVMTTDTHPTAALEARYRTGNSGAGVGSKILDVPLRLQADVCGNPLKDRCQSAALASAMQYFGKPVPLEHIICYTTDPEYESFGIWPRTINAAVEHGFRAYIDRFRDWDAVRQAVAENKVVLCSITMPASKEYVAPPYEKIGGHIVALCGVTDDGRVVVTDSAAVAQQAKEGGRCLQWLQADFEKIWMRNKGGVGMVICPPPRAPEKLVRDLAAYPRPVPAGPPTR